MTTKMQVDEFFDKAKIDWSKKLARVPPVLEIEEWGDENGPLTLHLIEPPGYAQQVLWAYDNKTEIVAWSAAYLIVHSHDMFGQPFFYDKVNSKGEDLAVEQITDQIKSVVERFIQDGVDSKVIVASGTKALTLINKQEVTPEDVKKHASMGMET